MTTEPPQQNTPAAELPSWLEEAEAAYEETQAAERNSKLIQSKMTADRINARLAALGITPAKPAYGTPTGVVPAVLVPADPEAELYGVHADWTRATTGIRLLVSDYESTEYRFNGVLPYGDLEELPDIPRARRMGPPGGRPPRPLSLRELAISDLPITNAPADPIATQVNLLRAAVLHFADAIARMANTS